MCPQVLEKCLASVADLSLGRFSVINKAPSVGSEQGTGADREVRRQALRFQGAACDAPPREGTLGDVRSAFGTRNRLRSY